MYSENSNIYDIALHQGSKNRYSFRFRELAQSRRARTGFDFVLNKDVFSHVGNGDFSVYESTREFATSIETTSIYEKLGARYSKDLTSAANFPMGFISSLRIYKDVLDGIGAFEYMDSNERSSRDAQVNNKLSRAYADMVYAVCEYMIDQLGVRSILVETERYPFYEHPSLLNRRFFEDLDFKCIYAASARTFKNDIMLLSL